MSVRNHLPALFGAHSRGDELFTNLQSEIDRVFGQFHRSWPEIANSNASSIDTDRSITPKMNISETEDTVEIEAELPGFEAKDIEVTSHQGSLVIEARNSSSTEEKKKDYYLVERSEGAYRRVIPVGFDIEEDSVTARSKDGILTVSITKPAVVKESARKIAVETS